MRARKKPVEIEYMQFSDKANGAYNWEGAARRLIEWCPQVDYHEAFLGVETLEGFMRISRYDYIIKGVKGEFYPCKPDIFEATYDLID